MSIPAVARGRHLIADVLARQPLVAYGNDGVRLAEQPAFLTRSAYFPPRLRTLWTIDDLIFYGWSLWLLDLGAADARSGRAPILDALRIDPTKWRQVDGQIVVKLGGKDQVIPPGTYLLIPGLDEGLLRSGARTIRGARLLEERWSARVKNPVPVTEIRYTGEEDLDEEEMRDIRASYIAARADDDGTVMVTPRGFEVHAHGDQALELFVQGRNAVSLDIARFLDMPASLIDASQVNGSSIDYENNAIGRSSYYDLTLRSWALPLEEALSQDDVLPRGQYVQFDLSALATPDAGTGPALED
ncbi:phage portal protein [Actinotalea ferrariae]|uniref:phage portal protein n=1 Tax=Actinotalea ferrariae TaxID=1386098 RepID=UPI001C8BB222|nr:phage portal protein [Actinotalea ferrariae]MBX9243419.1 phage portal protein [Actinotalea ferrariae]